MGQTPQQWYEAMQSRLAEQGYTDVDVSAWTAWPWHGELTPRELQPPVETEPERAGVGGVECHACTGAQALEPRHAVWHDDAWYLTVPAEGSPFPFACFLMPKRHADLQDLTPQEARRQGELLTALEQAACEVLTVPRVQVARWGDGGEHLHWWVFARPTGALQLRGTFMSLWGLVLPPDDAAVVRAAVTEVAGRLCELVGGEVVTP